MSRTLIVSLVFFVAAPLARGDDREYAAELKKGGHSATLDREGRLLGITFNKSEMLAAADYERVATLAHLKRLTFYGDCKMTDANAAALSRLASVEELAANGTALSDDGFRHLAKLTGLRKLTIWHLGWQNKALTGRGFAALAACPVLESFNFSGSTVGDAGLEALGACKGLRDLVFYHTRVTDAGLRSLRTLPNLRSVHVGPQFSMRLGDEGMAELARAATLESIEFDETILTYAGSLDRLKGLKALKQLKLDKTEISPADLGRLKADLPGVTIEHAAPEPKRVEEMRRALPKRK